HSAAQCSGQTRRPRSPQSRRPSRQCAAAIKPAGTAVHTWVVTDMQRILVSGATGKVGQAFIGRLLSSGDDRFAGFTVSALCHHRTLEPGPRMEVVTGSIDQRETADRALNGVTHVLHLATSKETPETIMDVAVKGLFWLLEACRASRDFRQFILIGG